MTEWTQDHVLALIKLVRERPAIYQRSKEYYRPQYHREEMFQQCHKALQNIGLNASIEEIKKKWSTLRNSYKGAQKKIINSKNSKRSRNNKPSLYYFKEMSFLDENVEANASISHDPQFEIDSGERSSVICPEIILKEEPTSELNESSSSLQKSFSDRKKLKINNGVIVETEASISHHPQFEIDSGEESSVIRPEIILNEEPTSELSKSLSYAKKSFPRRKKMKINYGDGECLSTVAVSDTVISMAALLPDQPPVEDMSLCIGCHITITNILEKIGSEEKNVEDFFKRHGILRMSMNCPHCNGLCWQLDQYFRCYRKRYLDGQSVECNFVRSIKSNTWIADAKLPLITLVKLITIWLLVSDPTHDFMRECLYLSPDIVDQWSNIFQKICINSQVLRDVQVIGGCGKIVEVGEADLGSDKTHLKKQEIGRVWVFGAFERGSKICFFEPVQDISAPTLIEIIERRIAPGTTIISSTWEGYNPLRSHPDYLHIVVGRSENVEAHTQNIRRMWRQVRSSVPKSATKHLEGYLAECLWKREFELKDRVHFFLLEVGRQFNPNKDDDR